jgi:hypothetical protein
MDFRDWKKVKEDGKTCTLEHPKGHRLTVALRGLSALHRDQIKMLKMAKGGKACYDEGTPDGPVSASDADSGNSAAPNITINNTPAPQPAAPAPNPVATLANAPVAVNAPAPVQGESNVLPNGQTNPAAVNRNAQQSVTAQRDIDVAQAQAENKNLQDYNKAVAQANQDYQARYNDLSGHVNDFANYMAENPIDPKHYQENMGSGAKVATAIGLFFGGLGTPFGGHNYAMDFLNKQIDRDIDAQRSRADQQKTILGGYQHLYGEGKEAYAATRATMLDIFNNKQKMIAAQLGTPQAYAKSLALSNQIAIDKQKALKDGATQINALPGYQNVPNPKAPQSAPVQMSPRAAGPKSGPAAPTASGKTYQILSPSAQSKYDNIMRGYDPQWSGKSDLINQQYTAAQQAEKVLNGPNGDGQGGIHDILQEMYDAQKNMGLYGHLHEKAGDALAALPFVGAAAGHAPEVIPPTHSEKRFNTLRTNLEADLGTALNGIMTPSDIHNAVAHSAPAYQDTPEDVDFKEKQFVNSVLKAVRTSALQGVNGMLAKSKKAR